MRTDSKLSRMLHVLLHMARNNKTYTSDEIAQMLVTNPVVIRRTMAGLKKAGFIHSEKVLIFIMRLASQLFLQWAMKEQIQIVLSKES